MVIQHIKRIFRIKHPKGCKCKSCMPIKKEVVKKKGKKKKSVKKKRKK